MGTLSRKQREIQERELRLLDVGRKMLVEQGFAGLNMDRLAESAEYSKGTVYQHFSSKEDLVAALAVQTCDERARLFQKALAFKGGTRERFMAVGMADELFVRLHPHYFRSEMVVRLADLGDRVSPERLAAVDASERNCCGNVLELLREAVACGDLPLAPGQAPQDVLFAVLALSIGANHAMFNYQSLLQRMEIASPLAAYREATQTLLDGFGWKPLRAEWNYEETLRRITQEVFADEWRQAASLF